MKRIIYIPFDHLHRKYGALKDADPKTDVIAFQIYLNYANEHSKYSKVLKKVGFKA